jgi:hypothetical protein
MGKRVIGGVAGLGYAICYGFWTMLLTGGGHGNFIWMILFFTAYFFGLFFPVMGALVVDLRSVIAKAVFGTFLFVSLLINVIMITPILLGSPGDTTTDFEKSLARDTAMVIFSAIVHFLPLAVLSLFLVRSIFLGEEIIENDEPVGLGVN